MAQTKIEQGLLKFTEATDYLKIPTGTTAQRPSSPSAGYIRFNTTISAVETYDGTKWVEIGLNPPTFSSVDYPGSATALNPDGGESLVINGDTFNVGITVTIGGTTPSTITRNSATQLTVTTPAKTAGTYDIVFTNTDGGTATATNAVSYNGIPAFTNAAGSLGSVKDGNAINFSVAATEPDGGAITYAVTSGALPSGASLNTTTGAITGTAPSVSADTTSNFTITATDNENQTASRAYSITITPILPSDNFQIVTYTGTSATQSITGVGFKPDLVWIKDRGNAEQHILNDSTRGASYDLSTNTTTAQANRTTGFTSFDNDGFTLGTDGGGVVNDSTRGPYVAWCWKANGGTTSSNTDGTITSTVQVNQNLGFSIVQATASGGVNATNSFGHGLGVTPAMIILKETSGVAGWLVWHQSFSNTAQDYLTLNTTNAKNTASQVWANSAPTSTVFSATNGWSYNTNATVIAYCFAEVESFSKIGSYTGNGSDNGPIVETGFEPAFVMGKRTDTADNWWILDNKRNTSNPRNTGLFPNLTSADLTGGYSVNFLSNGFQVNTTNAALNANGGTYIYMAFAADPDTTSPTLADSFNITTYSGNSSTQNITGLGFSPSLVWIKSKNISGANHNLYDSVRGAGKVILSNSTLAEVTTTEMTGFSSDGFNFTGTALDSNNTGNNMVAWAWKADDALPTINTGGSINSLVSANANAGFSIVKYTIGTPSTSDTIGHGLSSTPELILTKNISTSVDWYCWHTGIGTSNYIVLNSTAAKVAYSGLFDSVTSTNFQYKPTSTSNQSYIAYCFHSVSGFSKIGSFTGNGTASFTNPLQNIGFRPDMIILKNASAVGNWRILDSVRGPAQNNVQLNPNTADAEYAGTDSTDYIKFEDNGFRVTTGNATYNGNGNTIIYAAFKIN